MIDPSILQAIDAGGNLGVLMLGLALMRTNARVAALEIRHRLEDKMHGK